MKTQQLGSTSIQHHYAIQRNSRASPAWQRVYATIVYRPATSVTRAPARPEQDWSARTTFADMSTEYSAVARLPESLANPITDSNTTFGRVIASVVLICAPADCCVDGGSRHADVTWPASTQRRQLLSFLVYYYLCWFCLRIPPVEPGPGWCERTSLTPCTRHLNHTSARHRSLFRRWVMTPVPKMWPGRAIYRPRGCYAQSHRPIRRFRPSLRISTS